MKSRDKSRIQRSGSNGPLRSIFSRVRNLLIKCQKPLRTKNWLHNLLILITLVIRPMTKTTNVTHALTSTRVSSFSPFPWPFRPFRLWLYPSLKSALRCTDSVCFLSRATFLAAARELWSEAPSLSLTPLVDFLAHLCKCEKRNEERADKLITVINPRKLFEFHEELRLSPSYTVIHRCRPS